MITPRVFRHLIATTALAGLPALAAAQATPNIIGEMTGLGLFPTTETLSYSDAYGVSGDGTVVTGVVGLRNGVPRGFYWTQADGMREIGALTSDGAGYSVGLGVSDSGRFVGGGATTDDNRQRAFHLDLQTGTMTDVGSLRTTSPGNSTFVAMSDDGLAIAGTSDTNALNRRAYRWNATTGIEDLGTLGGSRSDAVDINADGSAIAGSSLTAGGDWRAFRWTETGGMENLGTIAGGATYARAISADGSTVIGEDSINLGRAFRWTQAGGIQLLGTFFTTGIGSSRATDVDADGTVVVGHARLDSGVNHAFRWVGDDTGGVMHDLGTLRAGNAGESYASLVTPDGAVVAGSSDTDHTVSQAFRWTATDGMEGLGSLRTDNTGYSYPTDMSADGSVIVGTSTDDNGNSRAFAWNGAMVDLANTQATARMAAAGVGAASAEYNANAMRRLDRELDLQPEGGGDGVLSTQGRARAPVVLSFGAGLTRNADVGTFGRADVTGAMGLGGGYVLGGFLEVANESKTYGAVSLSGTHLAGGLSVRYRDNADFTGLTWRLASQFGTGDSTITRAAILPGTFSGTGKAGLDSGAVSAELGWGYAVEGGVVIPFARIAAARTTRDAYTETTAAAFPLSYDQHRETVSTVTLGLDSRIAVGAAGTLRLSGGMVHDLDRDRDPITGTSAIPGMATFSVAAPAVVNKTRAFGFVSYRHEIDPQRAITTSFGMAQQAWTGKPSSTLRVGYEVRF